MDTLLATLLEAWAALPGWTERTLLTPGAVLQHATAVVCCLLGWLLAAPMRRAIRARVPDSLAAYGHLARVVRTFIGVLPALVAILLLLAARGVLLQQKMPAHGVKALGDVLLAYALVRLLASVVVSRFWGRAAAVVALFAVGLQSLGALGPVLGWLDGFGVDLGGTRVTLLVLAKATVLLVVFVRLGSWASELAERRMLSVPDMSPSMRVLLGKIVRVSLFVLAVLVALGSVGIDLTALTVFSGAVGVGLGFGLQKVFANLVSGFILLMDKSIKPGDVIALGEVYGWIKELRARFVSVVTRDGTEYLIPNEDLITGQVVNWSFSDSNVRLKVPVGVAYDTPDVRRALEVMATAASGIPRVLDSPAPVALFRGFGDSALDLELRFWVADPQNGVANVSSEVGLAVLDALRAEGIQIPFPQRDLHLVSGFAPARTDADPEPGPDKR